MQKSQCLADRRRIAHTLSATLAFDERVQLLDVLIDVRRRKLAMSQPRNNTFVQFLNLLYVALWHKHQFRLPTELNDRLAACVERGRNCEEPGINERKAPKAFVAVVRPHRRHISNLLCQLIAEPSTNRSLTIRQGKSKRLIPPATLPDQAALV